MRFIGCVENIVDDARNLSESEKKCLSLSHSISERACETLKTLCDNDGWMIFVRAMRLKRERARPPGAKRCHNSIPPSYKKRFTLYPPPIVQYESVLNAILRALQNVAFQK